MSLYPKSANLLIEQLAKLPGVGKATAKRLAFFILKSDQKENIALASAIKDVKENVPKTKIKININFSDVEALIFSIINQNFHQSLKALF